MTADEALEHAVRLLQEAEMCTGNIALMERLEHLADSWITVAHLLSEMETGGVS